MASDGENGNDLMADISDVEGCLVDQVAAIIYPFGLTRSTIFGAVCRIYRGWPNAAALNSDLSGGIVNVTVNSDNEGGRLTTRYLAPATVLPGTAGTVATVNDTTVTISGAPRTGDLVGALVDGVPSVYRVVQGDTPDQVAASLGVAIQARHFVAVRGPRITVANASAIIARCVCDRTAQYESRRQEKDFRLSFWCPSPSVRDTVVSAIDTALSGRPFLTLQDDTSARMVYKNTVTYDQAQNASLYRRDLVYTIEYPTISTLLLPSMVFGDARLNGSPNYG
jgi:hypothetical protein